MAELISQSGNRYADSSSENWASSNANYALDDMFIGYGCFACRDSSIDGAVQ
jgi:hypothetical protein